MSDCDYGGFDYECDYFNDLPGYPPARDNGPLVSKVNAMFLGLSFALIVAGLACLGLAAWLSR